MSDPTLSDLADEFLVECPRCGRRALVRDDRLVCPACGLTREAGGGPRLLGEAKDGVFGLPLWLRSPCAGRELWAYNGRHLDALAAIVGASGERRARAREDGTRNRLLASRLPRWMLAARRREDVLAGLARLRARLTES
jgi:hypothetical protein